MPTNLGRQNEVYLVGIVADNKLHLKKRESAATPSQAITACENEGLLRRFLCKDCQLLKYLVDQTR